MIGHITYLSETSMREKFGRRLQEREQYGYEFATEFEVESYLKYQGNRFTKRFDANSFLYITKAIDYFDLSLGRGDLAEAFRHVTAKFLVVSYSSDWLYPPEQSEEMVRALLANGIDATLRRNQERLRPRRVSAGGGAPAASSRATSWRRSSGRPPARRSAADRRVE